MRYDDDDYGSMSYEDYRKEVGWCGDEDDYNDYHTDEYGNIYED